MSQIVLFLQSDTNEYQRSQGDEFMAATRRHGLSAQIVTANDDPVRQAEQIQAVVRRSVRATALVVSPVCKVDLTLLARRAVRSGTGWIMLDRWVNGLLALRREFPRVPIFSVTSCHDSIGRAPRHFARGVLDATVRVPPTAGRAVDEIVAFQKGDSVPPRILLSTATSAQEPTRAGCLECRPDGALLEALRRGDPGAQAAAFDLYEPAVRRVLIRILRDDPSVDDALQDTFVKAFRSVSQVKEPQALRAWVLRVAESVGLDEFRRSRRSRARTSGDIDSLDLCSSGPSFELRRAASDACRLLSILPTEERRVLTMRRIDGLELAKIARACDVSVATVKRRLVRASDRFEAMARRQPSLCDWVSD